jgi:hypothetical protein
MKYLHTVSERVSWLDHRVLPEVRAMLAAMMSRVPQGGIEARYLEVVENIKSGTPWLSGMTTEEAEEYLANYLEVRHNVDDEIDGRTVYDEEVEHRLHPVIQRFFDKFVGEYGHGSIKELTGSPTVFIEHISWWFAYLTFDNPLVRGQEMSTRAVWREHWPMAEDSVEVDQDGCVDLDKELMVYHRLGLEIAKHEIEWWKDELRKPCAGCGGNGSWYEVGAVDSTPCPRCNGTGKKYPWMNDPQPFRPAFDRARWALPGTIETGVSHCADIRTMGRVIQQMEDVATASGHQQALDLLEEVKQAYREALPGMAGMWHREALHDADTTTKARRLPDHINQLGKNGEPVSSANKGQAYASLHMNWQEDYHRMTAVRPRASRHEYVDPFFNRLATVRTTFRCSLAAARDWHRHRSMMPWQIRVVREDGRLVLDQHYEPKSDFAKANFEKYMKLADMLHHKYLEEGNQWMAMLCLPLGARVSMAGGGGLQHALYMLELRGWVAGGNFEYQEQARDAMANLLPVLRSQFGDALYDTLGLSLPMERE